jgi:hypothetical protein
MSARAKTEERRTDQVLSGEDVVKAIERQGAPDGKPKLKVRISDCGMLGEDGKAKKEEKIGKEPVKEKEAPVATPPKEKKRKAEDEPVLITHKKNACACVYACTSAFETQTWSHPCET